MKHRLKKEKLSSGALTLVVFGATGDLYQSKLALALFNLFQKKLLPKDVSVIGFGRRQFSDSDFRNFTKTALQNKCKKCSPKILEKFFSHFFYTEGDLNNLDSFKKLGVTLEARDRKKGICSNKLFYLAVPPIFYEKIFKNIHDAGLTITCAPGIKEGAAWTRVLVEKPFGKNIKGAKHLDRLLGRLFDESQIFRIDHYLAKEAMQDLLDMRFGKRGSELEPFWNGKYIKKIKIVFYEKEGVGHRGAFYDDLGALLDVGQNHMLQMLAIVAMENPQSGEAQKIQNARAEVFKKVFLPAGRKVFRAQYAGYASEPNVKPKSATETFFRLPLIIKNKRWLGVDFELEAGKALAKSEVFIEISFKENEEILRFYISPDKSASYDAYEKVFYDCLLGDQTLFVSTEEVMEEWRIITEAIKNWQKIPFPIYEKGSLGDKIK